MATPTTDPRASASTPSDGSPGPRRSRRLQIGLVVAAVAVLGIAALIFFLLQRGGGGKESTSAATTTTPMSVNVQLVLAGVQNANAGAPATLPDDAANSIMQMLGAYVDRGLVAPVKDGKPPENVAELFDAGAQEAIQGPDKDVLFENGEPKLTGDFKPGAQPVAMVALSDGNGQFVLVTAGFSYTADEGVQGGTLKTTRNVALTLAPDGGQWKITGYDVSVVREGAEVDVPTATAQR